MASLDGAMHLEPIGRLPSCCSPPKFGGHHDTCEDQFGERGGHHHHQLGGLWLKKIKTRAGSPSLITSMAKLLFNMRQPELLVNSVNLPLSTSTKYNTTSRPRPSTP